MKKLRLTVLLLFFVLLLSACGTHVVNYKPNPNMALNDALELIDRLIMEQHSTWRPDFVEVNDRYILLGYGTITRSSGSAVVNNKIIVDSGSSNTRAAGNRVYYESTDKLVLYSWKRKFKQWYVVSMVGKKQQHMLRTRNLEEAKKMVNALEVVLQAFKE